MREGVKEVAPGRFREVFGRNFEEFVVGHVYEHRPGRTITDADNVWFTLLTMNTHPAHFDYEFAKKTEFGKPLVVSPLTIALMTGMSVSDTSAKAAIHPSQIAAIEATFTPSAAELAEAVEALAAFRDGGERAIRFKGRMLEAPLVKRYRAILVRKENLEHA